MQKILWSLVCLFCLGAIVNALVLSESEQQILDQVKSKAVQVLQDRFPGWRSGDVQVQLQIDERKRFYLTDLIPTQDLAIHIFLPESSAPSDKYMLLVQLEQKEVKPKSFYLLTNVEVNRRVYVAGQNISNKTLISKDMLESPTLNIAGRGADLVFSYAEIAGLETKTHIRKGDLLRSWMFKQKPLIDRGQDITMIYHQDGIVLKIQGRAMEPGALGQNIRCYRVNSNKNFTGKVQDANTVLID